MLSLLLALFQEELYNGMRGIWIGFMWVRREEVDK